MFDLVIKNGNILDGTGSLPYCADIAINDGKIVRIGNELEEGKITIDAAGLTVTPGFIDSHSHSDRSLLDFPEQKEKIEQGITTSIAGQCGESVAPTNSCADFNTMGEFLAIAKNTPLGSNFATFIGHGTLRESVIGSFDREPTQSELKEMGAVLQKSIEQGAMGISFGLLYPPGCFASIEELTFLATVSAMCGGLISAHIRDEGFRLLESCEEFISIIKASGAKAVFSHHKAMYKENWGKVNTTLKMIDDAVSQGFEVYLDTYPYIASHTSLSSRFVPEKYHSGGDEALVENLKNEKIRAEIKRINQEKFGDDDLSWALLVLSPELPEYQGKRLNEIASLWGKDVFDTVFDIIIANKNNCKACFFLMCEEDVETVLAHPRCMICTDAAVQGNISVYHPRLRGSFPRALGKYSRERAVVPLNEMIRKMTSLPAKVYGLKSKGVIKEGFDADLCIFDGEKIRDRSEYFACHERAQGLNFVILNGKIVVENAIFNGTMAGKVLLSSQ